MKTYVSVPDPFFLRSSSVKKHLLAIFLLAFLLVCVAPKKAMAYGCGPWNVLTCIAVTVTDNGTSHTHYNPTGLATDFLWGLPQTFTVSVADGPTSQHYTVDTAVGGTCPGGAWLFGSYVTVPLYADCALTFNKKPNTYTTTFNAGPGGNIQDNNGTTGTTMSSSVAYGNYTPIFLAVANPGYHFVNWNGVESWTNSSIFIAPYQNYTYTANFALDYNSTLTYTAGPNGSLAGTTPQVVTYNGTGSAVTATPVAGYHFVNWSDGSTANPRTDANVTANVTVTANFAINTSATLTYIAVANGSITGTSPQTVAIAATGTAVTAAPATGYHFVNWSDGSTANPRTDANVIADITVTANFAINTYTVTTTATNGTITSANNPTVNYGSATTVTGAAAAGAYFSGVSGCGGTPQTNTDQTRTTFSYLTGAITGDCTVAATFLNRTYAVTPSVSLNGTITPSTLQAMYYGSTATFVVTPSTGYTASVGGTCGGSVVATTSLGSSIYFTNPITAACTVTANFAINTYTLIYTAGANGSITGTTPQTVNHSANGTAITAVPNTGYHFVNWSDGSTTNPRTDTTVTANVTVTANFAINTYTLTYTAGAHGSITGTTPQTVNHGSNGTAVRAVPSTGYRFVNWNDASTFNPRTDLGVTGNVTVTANFASTPSGDTFTVTPQAGAGGSISPSTAQHINSGSKTQFTVTPATGYSISSITGCGGTLAGNIYTTAEITGNCTVTAAFGKKSYQVTPSAGENGSISPNTPQSISLGSITVFTVTPTAGYTASVGGTCGGSLSGTTYTTSAIAADCTVVATFTPDTASNVCTYSITPTNLSFDSSGGTATVSITKSSTACVWLAVSNASWINVTSGSIGQNNSTVNFTVASNAGAPRTGTLTIAGQTFTVAQADIFYSLVLTKSGTGSGKGLLYNSDSELLCGADCELAILKYETGTQLTLSAEPETGSIFKGWNGETCPETGACTLTITLNDDTSINAVFSAAGTPEIDLNTSTLLSKENEVYINVPVIKYVNSTEESAVYYSAELMYVLTDDNKLWFKLTGADVITDITPYLGTQMSHLYFAGSALMLHLHNITINGAYLWEDLKYMPTNDGILWFVVTASGSN